MIILDGRANANLDWAYARQQAVENTELVWKIDLGLFSELKHPLSHKSQHMSLRLSLEHFRDGLWKEFQGKTKEIILYSGSLDFSKDFLWDEEQQNNFVLWLEEGHQNNQSLFCADVLADYLSLLTAGMPDEMPFTILLDASDIEDPALEATLRNRERFQEIKVRILNSRLLINDQAKTAICFPSKNKQISTPLLETIRNFSRENKAFRLIPEDFLIQEWDGLDDLIVDPSTIDVQLKRKLQGFQAAGGGIKFV